MLTARTRVAVAAARAVNWLSRLFRQGHGTVVGGRVGLAISRGGLAQLGSGRRSALVSGTNGKTTTTRLLAAGLEAGGATVVSNATGSNMPAGHFAALAGATPLASAVLEVDEGYLVRSVRTLGPEVVVLLNLSRDQLDRSNEVRMVAERWRQGLGETATTVVANADDPLVVFAASSAASVLWVAGGGRWRADAAGCPACGGRIRYAGEAWSCDCGFARPTPDVAVEQDDRGRPTAAVLADGRRFGVSLAIPGAFNARNAVVAAAAASVLGVAYETSLPAMARVEAVAGRFSLHRVGGVAARLLLAKNPAGFEELLDLLTPGTSPVVVAINARVADGRDPSWLWDVAFERLAGRPVVASGERSADLSVRLDYGGVAYARESDPVKAVAEAARLGDRRSGVTVEFIGNYTAFHDLLRAAA